MDTTMRDAHQSLLVTRVRTHDLKQSAIFFAKIFLNSLVWKIGEVRISTFFL